MALAVGLCFSVRGVYGSEWVDDKFFSDPDSIWSGSAGPSVMQSAKPWTLSLSGGLSIVNKVSTAMDVPQVYITMQTANAIYYFPFGPRTYSVTSFDNGYSALIELTRHLTHWIDIGVQGGASFGHSTQVETGSLLWEFINGNNVSFQVEPYTVDYEALIFHAEPIVEFGPWIPMGRFAWQPYVSAGVGPNEIVEKIVVNTCAPALEAAWRTTTAVGAIAGGGLNFRFSTSGSIGLEYQVQRIFTSPNQWTLSLPTLRASYLF
jgi:hypothetical protein